MCKRSLIIFLAILWGIGPGVGRLRAQVLITVTNPTPASSEFFGFVVAALSTNRVIIGATGVLSGGPISGEVYVFSTNGTLAATVINPSPGGMGDAFGSALAALGEDRIAVGDPLGDGGVNNVGVVYIFSTNGVLQTTIQNPTPLIGDNFGAAVAALDANRVAIGAFSDDSGATDSGNAYLYSVSSPGSPLITFANPTPAGNDFFGRSVAIAGGNRILIGADGDNTGATDAGAAYLFGTNGALLLTVTNPTPAASDFFGYSVAGVGAERFLIGAYGDTTGAGAAYLYSTNGTLLTTFLKPGAAAGDNFGYAVAAVGTDKVLIGARFDDAGATDAGAAYLFSTNGALLATYTNATPASGDNFGSAVAGVGANGVLIGAQFDDTGAANAGAAYLYLNSSPLIATHPASQSVGQGSNATFSVVASGTPPPGYQWQFNGTNIAGATNTSFTRTNAQPADAGNYSVTVNNGFGAVTSSNAVLSVGTPPSILVQPAGLSVTVGSNATFSVVADGTAPLSYQWRVGGTPIANATNSVFTRTNTQQPHGGNYSVVVSNAFGTVTSSNALLVVNLVPPSIATQPTNRTVAVSNTVTFTVVAQGSAPLSFQWRKGGVAVPGATSTNLSLTNVQPSAAGRYDVVVTNAAGSATSLVAVLSVTVPGRIDTSANGANFPTVETDNFLFVVHNIHNYTRTNEIDGFNFRVTYDPSLFAFVSNSFSVGFPGQQWLSKANQEGAGFTIASFSTATNPGVIHVSVRDITPSAPERGTVATIGNLIFYQLQAIAPGVGQLTVLPEEDGTFLFDTAMQPAGEPSLRTGGIITNRARVTIAITNPPARICLPAPATIPVQADVGDPFGVVRSVEFYVNGLLAEQVTNPPYSITLTNLEAGRYTLTAVTREDFGNAHGSVPVEIAVALGADFGDAPTGTLLTNDGPRHCIIPGFHLGQRVDAEPDGQPNANATGDDLSPSGQPSDEDGVTFTSALAAGEEASIEVVASTNGVLYGWIGGVQVLSGNVLIPGTNSLNFTVPSDMREGRTIARFRFSSADAYAPNTFNRRVGLALDGEVEDYEVTLQPRPPRCEPTSKGYSFWVAFPGQYAPDHPEELSLCLAGNDDPGGESATRVYVDVPGLGFAGSTTANGAFALPAAASLGDDNDVISSKGVFIESPEREMAVSGLSHTENSSDAFLALPVDALGREYIVQGFRNTHSGVPSLNGSQFAIVAPSDGTVVTITPSVTTGRRLAGQPYDITLNRGQTYQLRVTNGAPRDLSGTIITANKPVAVFGGHRCTTIPDNTVFFCDYVVEQLLPVGHAGREFVTVPLATRSGDTFRFLAVRNDTTVCVNGTEVVTNLDRGQTYQLIIDGPARITSDEPILVTQYANSSDYDDVIEADPFMVVVAPLEMFTDVHDFCVPGNTNFTSHYINVVVGGFQTEGGGTEPGGVLLDGVGISPGLFEEIGSSGYYGAQVPVSPGVHRVDGNFCAVTVYGWGEFDSYGYPGGLFFPDVTPPAITILQSNLTIVVADNTMEFSDCITEIPYLLYTDGSGPHVINYDDVCNFRIDQFPSFGEQVGLGVHPVTITATDHHGNESSVVITITVVDASGPFFTCPLAVLTNCAGPEGAAVFYEATARGSCIPLFPVFCVPPSGSLFPPGTNFVTCTAVNGLGATATCSFPVVVNLLQTITLQAGQTVITWTGPGALETAFDVTGPWLTLTNATSPFHLSPTNARAFFRIRCDIIQ